MSIAAVIKLTSFDENLENAIKSVVGLRDRIQELYIISFSHSKESKFYDGFKEDIQILEEHDEEFQWFVKPEMDYKTVNADLVLEIPPYCDLKVSGVELLQKAMNNSKPEQIHFALRTTIQLKTTFWFSFFWYGFLQVIISWIHLFQPIYYYIFGIYQHRTTDVILRKIVQSGPKKFRYIPKPNDWHPFLRVFAVVWSRTKHELYPTIFPKDQGCAVLKPDIQGHQFFIWYTKHLGDLGFGAGLFFFFCYWLFFIIAFFSPITMGFGIRSLFLWFIQVIRFAELYYYTTNYYDFTGILRLSILNHFFLLSFPILFLYAKATKIKKTWSS